MNMALISFRRGGVKLTTGKQLLKAFCSSAVHIPTSSKAVVYSQYGDPTKVLSLQDTPMSKFDDESLLLKMLASPINPADINMIQGSYPIKPNLPAIGGNEGVGEVLTVGSEVKDLKRGDWVIMAESGLGCWSEMKVLKKDHVLKIPQRKGVSITAAATLAVNPCTAYWMLKDFETMQPGDVVLQNGSNSSVGEAVIQLAACYGLVSLNVIRERPNFDEVEEFLKGLGATYVVSEKEFGNVNKMKDILKNHPAAKLALNCVGGKSATQLIRYLSQHGTMVTYGGMSRKPITVPTSAFIFKDVNLRGFWMTRWNECNANDPEKSKMLEDLCDLVGNGKFQPPVCEKFQLDDFENAIENSMKPYSKKSLLQLSGAET